MSPEDVEAFNFLREAFARNDLDAVIDYLAAASQRRAEELANNVKELLRDVV